MTFTLVTFSAGFLLAVIYAASPLTVWVLLAAPLIAVLLGGSLPREERRVLYAVLAAAFAARVVFVGAQFLAATPDLNDLSIGGLGGDESYYLSRALRSRDIVLGFAAGKYDYFVANDDYGRTSYLALLTGIQVIFGPTPYSMKLVNALLFIGGATLLFRMAYAAFGALPAFMGLVVLLFLPSLYVSSVSLLKESLYFLVASVLLVSSVRAIRAVADHRGSDAAIAIAIAIASLWLLDDLRRGALLIGLSGIGTGLALYLACRYPRRGVAVAAAVLVGIAVVLSQPSVRGRALEGVATAAKMHAGHVFTVGHAYKLMDEGFYKSPEAPMAWDLRLTEPQAMRYLVRAAVSFLVTPLPWEMRSVSELAFMPEHLVWYLLLALLPMGVAAGWKQDPLVTSLLIGFALPTAAVLALTTGNVGTLLRLRGLVTPYIVWLGAVGLCAVGERLLTRTRAEGMAL